MSSNDTRRHDPRHFAPSSGTSRRDCGDRYARKRRARLAQTVAGRAIAAGLALALVGIPFVACSSASTSSDSTSQAATSADDATATSTTATSSVSVSERLTTVDTTDLFTDRDLDASYDASDAVTITLSDDGSSASGSGVTIDGSTITITEEGTYVLTGTLTDGQVVVDVEDTAKVQIVLSDASISTTGASAIYVRQADKVFLTLAEGTTNTVSATGASEEVENEYATDGVTTLDGAIFSRSDLVVNGSGSLSVTSEQGSGIVCKDDLKLVDGTVDVTAANHGLEAEASVRATGGTYTIVAGVDGIHCENADDATEGWIYVEGGSFDITATSDGIDAGYILEVAGGTITVAATDDGLHAEYDLVILDGTVTVTTSYEALEGARIGIYGGTIDVTAEDDGLNASGDPDETEATESTETNAFGDMMGGDMGADMMGDDTAYLIIAGGYLHVSAAGDGIDSNGDLDVTGGETYVDGPENSGNGAIDYGENCTATITGGTLVATGYSGMAESFSAESTQASMLVSVSGSAGDTITVTDEHGNVVLTYTAQKSFDCLNLSCAELSSDGTYTVTAGSNSVTVTMSGVTYSDVAGMMGGGMGDMGGQMGEMGGGQMGDMGGQMGGAPGQMGTTASSTDASTGSTSTVSA